MSADDMARAHLVAIASAILRRRYRHRAETDLQQALAKVFSEDGIQYERECRLSSADRPDFLIHGEGGSVAVEVKVGGSMASLARQVQRYAGHPSVAGVLVVTSRIALVGLPETLAGKPVLVAYVGGVG